MTWVTPSGARLGSPSQVPYFIAATSSVGSGALKNGWCLGAYPAIGGPLGTVSYNVSYASGSQTLTAARIYFARTGAVSGANLLLQVWHSNFDGSAHSTGSDFTSLTPDATATIPLASLPLVSAADNYHCIAGLPAYTEVLFDHPVVFTGATGTFEPFLAFRLDSGFSAASNIVACGYNNAIDFTTSNSLDHSSSGSRQWFDAPGAGCNPAGIGAQETWPDLNFDPVPAVATGASWSAVIG